MEWINSRYADLVAAVRTAEAASGDGDEPPLRAFLVPDLVEDEG